MNDSAAEPSRAAGTCESNHRHRLDALPRNDPAVTSDRSGACSSQLTLGHSLQRGLLPVPDSLCCVRIRRPSGQVSLLWCTFRCAGGYSGELVW
jgi:hypothetical protein